MLKTESFMIVYYGAIDKTTVVLTKNCTPKRATRLFRKFLKKNYGTPSGTYVGAYGKRTISVKPFTEAVKLIPDTV